MFREAGILVRRDPWSLMVGERVQRPLDRAASLCRACRAPGDLS